jgi:RNA polymerase sigma-70 factor (ECF subfamily)
MSGQDHIEASLREAAPDLLAYFERRVAPREDAADLLGELMLQAWRNARSAPAEEEQRRMWLYGVARNVLANHTRSVRRRTALVDRLRRHLSVVGDTPDEAEGSAVRDLVQRLPDSQRELIALVHWDRLTIAQAAEVLGLNASTARGRYSAAREALRAAVDDAEATSPTGGRN